MTMESLPFLLFQVGVEKNPFLTPIKKWSNFTGKVFDLEEPDA